jgi:hypothetical protein
MSKSELFYFAPLVEFKASKILEFMVIFTHLLQVENTVFRVPQENFKQSSNFLNRYGINWRSEDDNLYNTYIELEDTKAVEFTAFLKVLIRP